MKIKIGTRFQLFNDKLAKKLDKARFKALIKAGSDARREARNAISNRKLPSKPKLLPVGHQGGIRQVAEVYGVPKAGKVTSWKTSRHPGGFLRDDILYAYDNRQKSVVVGPVKSPRVNQLHEFGGQQTFNFVPTSGVRPSRKFGPHRVGYLSNRTTSQSTLRFSRSIRKRPYMAPGLKKVMPKIAENFRDQIKGP
jgi:hypothetical protein